MNSSSVTRIRGRRQLEDFGRHRNGSSIQNWWMKTQKRGGVEEEELIHFVDGTAFVGVVYGYITAFIDFLELLSINPLWNHWSYLPAFLIRA